jgi:hypothetical protein
MTPKEKAIEIVDSYFTIIDGQVEFKLIKQCALIAVDEILKEYVHAENHIEDIMGKISIYIKYWQEVKQEIEAL